ncbi:MAG: YbjQ family protein [Thermotaleaceae bacterium]
MLIVTTQTLSGKEISETLGLVEGSSVQSKHIGKDIAAGLKTLVGGELKGYSEMLNDARKIATQRMVEQAQKMGADAIVNVRYSSSAIAQGAAEILVYGTAVKLSK